MKFVSLRTKTSPHRRALDTSLRATPKSGTDSSSSHERARTYTELRQQIHADLRHQHPEWIQANGECPMCDAYEARLMELLEHSYQTG